jgi:integrase
MARKIRDPKLDTRSARAKLPRRREPYWRKISSGLSVGYRSTAGRWIALHYSRETGRRFHSIGTADDILDANGYTVFTFDQAQEQARKWMANLVRQDYDGETAKGGPYTVKDAMEAYLAFLREDRKTAADAAYRINAFILPKLGAIDLASPHLAKRLERWRTELAETPPRRRSRNGEPPRHAKADHSPEARRRRRSSANRVITSLKAALTRAWRQGHAPNDAPWRRLEPFRNVDAARQHYLSVAECKRLANACDLTFRPLVLAALVSGCRYSELCRLHVHDVNLDSGTLHVRQSKTGRGRHVVLSGEGQRLFAQWCAGRSGSELLFTKADGRPWEKSAQARPMAAACARAKIEPPINFHALRHTWASLSVMAGVPLLVVAKNLGHSDGRMVEKFYSHLAPSFLVDAIRAGAPTFGFGKSAKGTVTPLRQAGANA